MTAELGHFALILALAVAAWQCAVPLAGAYSRNQAWMEQGRMAAIVQLLLIAVSFAALTNAYLTSDFSVLNVAENSHSAKPLLYKITGVWGNHEGSMLLWVLILALFGATVALFGNHLPASLRARVLGVQGAIGLAFLLFIVLASNPFLRVVPPPIEGRGLNPILQDPALAFHPPFLYGGYVGLSVSFAFAVAALLEGKVDAAWARWVRPWTLLSWALLTIGIAMGSWWAYYELGWGGFWFWDPVENASFMPWLIATALLHSAIVVERRGALRIWTILLAILAFSLSLVGTFLVRSGILTSVHAFAVDPQRGLFILFILAAFIGGSLSLFAWRAPALRAGGLFAPISRESGLVMNNILLCTACAAVFIGTLYPLALETVTGDKISVGAPYFNLTFGPIILPLLLIMPFGPLLTWKRADALAVVQRLWWAAAVAIAVAVLVLVVTRRGPWLAPVAIAIGCWAVFGSLRDWIQKAGVGQVPLNRAWARFRGLPRAAHGTVLAHLGVGVLVIGVVLLSVWKQELVTVMKPGDTRSLAGYDIAFVSEEPLKGANYDGISGVFQVTQKGDAVATVQSEKRNFRPSNMPTTEVGLVQGFFGDIYIVLGDAMLEGRSVRIFYNPLASWIWLGATIMFLGGLLSLTDRRLRIGVPAPPRPAALPAAMAEAAE
jgi:cytochrome c-type biogenesis protein CcmF